MRSDSARGFTLIELVAVIAITSVLVATAVPRFASSQTYSTRGDTGALTSALRYAQKTAIAQHRMVYFVLDTGVRKLRLCYDSACTTELTNPVTQEGFNQTLSSSVSLSANSVTTLGFDPLGRPTNAAAVLLADNATFTVQNATQVAQSTVLTVEAETGYVH